MGKSKRESAYEQHKHCIYGNKMAIIEFPFPLSQSFFLTLNVDKKSFMSMILFGISVRI